MLHIQSIAEARPDRPHLPPQPDNLREAWHEEIDRRLAAHHRDRSRAERRLRILLVAALIGSIAGAVMAMVTL